MKLYLSIQIENIWSNNNNNYKKKWAGGGLDYFFGPEIFAPKHVKRDAGNAILNQKKHKCFSWFSIMQELKRGLLTIRPLWHLFKATFVRRPLWFNACWRRKKYRIWETLNLSPIFFFAFWNFWHFQLLNFSDIFDCFFLQSFTS